MRNVALIVACLLLALANPAVADDRQDCAGNDDARKLKACTALIDSGQETRPNLAADYRNRGDAQARLKAYDAAIADYSKAIELDPHSAGAYNDRALAYTNKGDFQHAVADVTQAVELALTPATPATTPTPSNADKAPLPRPAQAVDARPPLAVKARGPTDAQIARTLVEASRKSFAAPCVCPDDIDPTGRKCGSRSLYTQPAARLPLCYPEDVTLSMIAAYRERLLKKATPAPK